MQQIEHGIWHKLRNSFAVCGLLCMFTGVAAASSAPTIPSQPELSYDFDGSAAFLPAESASSFDAAIEFIRVAGISRNLSLLLLEDVKTNKQVDAAIDRIGMDRVQRSVIRAIKAAQRSHEREWTELLAGIYSTHFDAAALRSILRERESSSHFLRLVELQDTIALAIRKQGAAVFAHALDEVMGDLTVQLAL